MNDDYQTRLSEAISWLRFPFIFFIIMLHCFSVQQLEGDHDLYFKTLYPFSLWLGETGVPGFFFISGYLFFLSKKTYVQKIHSRVQTLLVPYLLWNLLLLVLYLASWIVGHPQDINDKNITSYTLIDYLRLFWDRGSYDNGNFVPLLCPLWYIRNLFILSLISPLIYYVIRYTREFFLLAATLWWMLSFHNAFIPQTILFFSLGAYFSIFKINPLRVAYTQKRIYFILFSIFALSDIITHTAYSTTINLQIHRFAIIFNIAILLLIADCHIRHKYTTNVLPKAAFIVFCIHYPIVVILRKLCISQFNNANDFTHIILYFVCVISSTILSISFYMLMDKYMPRIKNILSGNR